MKYIAIAIVFLVYGCASDFTKYTIKKDNKLKTVLVKKVDNNYITSKNYIFTDDTKLDIKFNTVEPKLIADFEEKYHLQMEHILIVGDFIYSIPQNSDILDLISQISNESNVKSVLPLWNKKVNLR
jgi:hypothetical protein